MSNNKELVLPIIVMCDGQTWGDIEGCEIMVVTKQGYNKLVGGDEPNDLIPDEDFLPSASFQLGN